LLRSLVELDDLELERLALEVRRVAHGRTSTREPEGTRAPWPISTVKPPLTLPVMMPATILALVERGLQPVQCRCARLSPWRTRLAETVLDGFQRDVDLIATATLIVPFSAIEFLDGDHAFRLESCSTMTTSGLTSRPLALTMDRAASIAAGQ